MGGLTNARDMLMGGKTSDGASYQSHKAMKEAEVGPYSAPPPASVAPQRTSDKSDVGTTTLNNEKGLIEALMRDRKMTEKEAKAAAEQYKASKGYK